MSQVQEITIDELIEEFEFLGNWEEQCRYLIELGEELPELPPELKTEETRVHGCQSNVWFIPSVEQDGGEQSNGWPRIFIRAKSDARIVDGLIVVVLALCNGRTSKEILATDFGGVFTRLGLDGHLVPQRRNGLYAMVERVKTIAKSLDPDAAADDAVVSRPQKKQADKTLPVHSRSLKDRPPLDAKEVRRQFPALQQEVAPDVPVIFLDSASSSQKPLAVIEKEREVYEQYYANAYRGVYRFGDRVSRELEQSRETIRRFIGAEHADEVVFTSGTTMGINLVANAWGRKFLKPGDEIVLNELEHHANLVPWQWVAKQTGAVLRMIPLTDDGQLNLEAYDRLLGDKTRMVAVTGMSNVLGTTPPIPEIVSRAKRAGAHVLVDGAQSVPHLPTNVVQDDIDFLAFSGHKLYGPSGIGVLYGQRSLLEQMDPFLCGGHMIDRVWTDRFETAALPAKFEAGTLPIVQAIALGTAVDFVNEHALCRIHHHEQTLLRYAHERLGSVQGVKIYGPSTSHKGAIVSFTLEGAAPQDVASLLDLKGICVRHGHHCTMPLHDLLGLAATVRASFAMYNTADDVDALADGLQFVRDELKL